MLAIADASGTPFAIRALWGNDSTAQQNREIDHPMKRPNVAVDAAPRPSRIYVLLAAAWLIAAMAIGGLSLETTAGASGPTTNSGIAQP